MLLQISEVLPKEMQGILACCNPIPPLVKTELLTLHTIIREAREQTVIDVSVQMFSWICFYYYVTNSFFFSPFSSASPSASSSASSPSSSMESKL